MPEESVFGGWPRSGEIDIMELVGHEPSRVHGTVHYGTAPGAGHQFMGDHYDRPSGNFSEGYHVFSVEWTQDQILWFVDGIQFNSITPQDIAPYDWPFNEEFFIILNVAVGGNWPGSPNASTQFPQSMHIDYVRWYQQAPANVPEVATNTASLTVWPNPTREQFALEVAAGTPYSVFDMQGKMVLNDRAATSNPNVDVTGWAPGLYLVKTVSEGSVRVAKLLIE